MADCENQIPRHQAGEGKPSEVSGPAASRAPQGTEPFVRPLHVKGTSCSAGGFLVPEGELPSSQGTLVSFPGASPGPNGVKGCETHSCYCGLPETVSSICLPSGSSLLSPPSSISFLLPFLGDGVFLCTSGWLGTQDRPASPSLGLGYQAFHFMPVLRTVHVTSPLFPKMSQQPLCFRSCLPAIAIPFMLLLLEFGPGILWSIKAFFLHSCRGKKSD